MKKRHSLAFLILAFVFAQIAWLGLLGLWIYWYVSNNIIIQQVGDKLSPQIQIDNPNVFIFIGGIILIVLIAVAVFFIFRNLTVQMKLNSLYDNFIANVTHELKSPLSAIQLYTETMFTKTVQHDKQKEFLGMMLKDVNRLKKLINSILEISRLEKKRIAHDFRIYEVDSVFRSILNDSIEQFRLNENFVQYECNGSGKCLLDKDAIQIVFDNLIDNTIKYSVNQPEIFLKISCNKKHYFVEYSDKGIGIAAREYKKIFHKFYRVSNKNTASVKGTGLGLYWVREILKFHKGKVTVFSEGSNKGSCFRIELPVYQEPIKIFSKAFLLHLIGIKQNTDNSDGE
jgi:signal transduction histidine kinase